MCSLQQLSKKEPSGKVEFKQMDKEQLVDCLTKGRARLVQSNEGIYLVVDEEAAFNLEKFFNETMKVWPAYQNTLFVQTILVHPQYYYLKSAAAKIYQGKNKSFQLDSFQEIFFFLVLGCSVIESQMQIVQVHLDAIS